MSLPTAPHGSPLALLVNSLLARLHEAVMNPLILLDAREHCGFAHDGKLLRLQRDRDLLSLPIRLSLRGTTAIRLDMDRRRRFRRRGRLRGRRRLGLRLGRGAGVLARPLAIGAPEDRAIGIFQRATALTDGTLFQDATSLQCFSIRVRSNTCPPGRRGAYSSRQ